MNPPVAKGNVLISLSTDNEETEGSDVPADYLLGDVEADEDDLYMMDHENPHGE